ncbi:MAG TPA: S24 family peptidase [Anaerolineales bacterium]|nr:S24 family peptidase [Anaerolineales bacterium]
MKEDRLIILEALDHKNILTASLGREATGVLKKTLSPVQFIEKVTREKETEDCLHCGGQPFCAFLLALAYLELEASETARLLVDEAVKGFDLRGMNWNKAIAYWLQGIILLQEVDKDPAKRSLNKALEILFSLRAEFQTEGKYKGAEGCQKHIKEIQKTLKNIDRSDKPEKKTTPSRKPASSPVPVITEEPVAENEFYIAIPWIPVYKQIEVEAGLNGPVRTGQEIKQQSDLSIIYIEDKAYNIHPVRLGDKRITLSRDKQYGWVKVHGHSMKDAKPTSIQEGDYVLFYESGWPDQNEIVIVSKADASMVKRYLKEEQQLRSETSLKGADYDPVNITPEYLCLGVVIAVAKAKI